MAGFRTLAACEFVPEAARTYRANFPDVPLLERNIRDVTAADLLAAAGVEPGEVDVLEGSPPCSSFSASGSGHAGWGKDSRYSETHQRTDDLFFEFARILDGVQPRAFVAENVSGLARGVSQGYLKSICDSLRDECGFVLKVYKIDAQWLGVPQHRERLIFIGVREDVADRLGVQPEACVPEPQRRLISIREALATLPPPDKAERRARQEASIEDTSIGPIWDQLAEGESPRGSNFNLTRAHMDEPCPTITATAATVSSAGVTHPREPRKLTPAELKALASFPQDFQLTGTFEQRSQRIGRAVPPLAMRAIARRMRAALDAHHLAAAN
jgi:DNA (cytosine-5)-methyltransferase 1